jgi:hypothetical protein
MLPHVEHHLLPVAYDELTLEPKRERSSIA